MDYFIVLRILFLFVMSFVVAILLTPVLTNFLYKYKCWKKKVRTVTPDGREAKIFASMHKDKETSTPRMGGILIWVVTLVLTVAFWLLGQSFSGARDLNFLTRSEVWLPLFTLVAGAIIGLVDDILVISGKGKYVGDGIRFRHRVLYVALIGLIGALWFYFKLDWDILHIPFVGSINMGFWFIPFFIIVMLSTFSSGVVDGLDGLSAGTMLPVFGSFAVIAFLQGKYDLTAFLAVLMGAMVAYLWFNIPPARFYMGETGILGLALTLSVLAFLTNSVLMLPIIGFVLVIESLSVMIQLISKKLRNGKKVFLVSPIHHHFEAKGWPAHKVTMRFWLISFMSAAFGLIIVLLDKSL